ncbi:MAG: GNAT family N-acetyltransferase [Gammaproteobacteria bacterium]|nr:GNAT family N-acetyltransferase [Gammaproteobacteria bacterium]
MQQVTLTHDTITLRPLVESDIEPLVNIAEVDKLSNLWFTSVPNRERADDYFTQAFLDQEQGKSLVFAVVLNSTGEVVGSTRLYNARTAHKNIMLGYTWYAKKCQRTAVNTECKLLLLEHAFNTLDCISVALETHHLNHRSQQAILRLGAKQDGVLRSDQVLPDGSIRDTVRFSILKHEWAAIRTNLINKLQQYRA